MSYILDALRKSEQQRQAVQPDSVTERILVTPKDPPHKSVKLLAILAIGNACAVLLMAWLYWHKLEKEESAKTPIAALLPSTSVTNKLLTSPQMPEAQMGSEAKIGVEQTAAASSIAQILEQKKAALKATEIRQAVQPPSSKKMVTPKKEARPSDVNESETTYEPYVYSGNQNTEAKAEPSMPDVNTTPPETGGGLSKLNINVYGYAEKPEERFVIIDMVKYKAGQVVNGKAKLVEIRPDGIVMQDRYGKFTVERP